MSKKLLIFDLDGTLIDSLADIRSAVNHVRRAANLSDISLEQTRLSVGNGADLLIDRTIPQESSIIIFLFGLLMKLETEFFCLDFLETSVLVINSLLRVQ